MEQPIKRYVWLDTMTGKFSTSWSEKDQHLVTRADMDKAKKAGIKLLEYTCLNDSDFELYNRMKLK